MPPIFEQWFLPLFCSGCCLSGTRPCAATGSSQNQPTSPWVAGASGPARQGWGPQSGGWRHCPLAALQQHITLKDADRRHVTSFHIEVRGVFESFTYNTVGHERVVQKFRPWQSLLGIFGQQTFEKPLWRFNNNMIRCIQDISAH